MHPDELPIDEPLVRRLLAEQFPVWAELPLVRVKPEGTDSAIFPSGRRSRSAAHAPRWPYGPGGKEHDWLPRLAPPAAARSPAPCRRAGQAPATHGSGTSVTVAPREKTQRLTPSRRRATLPRSSARCARSTPTAGSARSRPATRGARCERARLDRPAGRRGAAVRRSSRRRRSQLRRGWAPVWHHGDASTFATGSSATDESRASSIGRAWAWAIPPAT
jgi:hypothetical protein